MHHRFCMYHSRDGAQYDVVSLAVLTDLTGSGIIGQHQHLPANVMHMVYFTLGFSIDIYRLHFREIIHLVASVVKCM